MLQQKREQIHRGVQREDREKLFQRIRFELLAGHQRGVATQDGQQDILDSIAHFINHQQPLDFEAINSYVCDYTGSFKQELIDQLIPLVIERFAANGRALACAANLLSKCEQNDVVDRLDIARLLKGLIQANEQQRMGDLNNGRPLTFLLFQLFRLASDKTAFAILPECYPQLIRAAGQFDVVLLLLLAEGSTRRNLLPAQAIIESYLAQDIPYEKLSQVGVYKLFQLIDNCLRFGETCQLYQAASLWIERRLRQRAFPLTLKPDLVRLMTMMLQPQEAPNYIDYLSKLSVFREILYLARFGSMSCKPPALQFLAALVNKASPQLLVHYAEQHQLVEVLVFALELDLEPDIAFKMLTALALLLQASGCHARKAQQLGLPSLLRKFEDCQQQKRIVEIAFCLQEILIEESLSRGL